MKKGVVHVSSREETFEGAGNRTEREGMLEHLGNIIPFVEMST